MTLRLCLVALAGLVLLAACSNPERVRITQSPGAPPPIPVRKPEVAAAGPVFNPAEVRSPSSVQSVPLGAPTPLPEPAAGTAVRPPPSPIPTPTPAATPPAPAPATAALPPGGRYRVQPGNTLYGIARRFGLPVQSIVQRNGLTPPYQLSPGQELLLPAQRVHRVEPGDTLYSLSRQYNVERSQLAAVNDLQAPYSLSVGQTLAIPATGPAPAGQLAMVPAAAPRGTQPASARTAAPQPPQPQTAQPQPAALPTQPPDPPPVPPTANGLGFLWPTQGRVIAEFGAQGDGRHNDGINIAAPRGAPVVAAERGEVVYAGNELRGFGNLLLIRHENGWVTAYAHNSSLLVSKGEQVSRGQVIARVGRSGNVDRPQLHFEIRKGSRAVDPRELLPS